MRHGELRGRLITSLDPQGINSRVEYLLPIDTPPHPGYSPFQMNKKSILPLFLIILVLVTLACSVERVLFPSQPTATATLPLIPTEVINLTATPISTPQPGVRIETADRALCNGDYELALQEYALAFENSASQESQAAALLGLGRAYYQMGDLENSLVALTSGVNAYSETSYGGDIYFTLGEVYEGLGQPVDAAGAFQEYLARRSGLIDFYIYERIGDNYFDAGSYQPAIDNYVMALQSPQIGDVLYLTMAIGDCYLGMGDPNTALLSYQDVAARTGNDYTRAEALRKSADIQLQVGNSEEAYALYHEVVDNYPLAYDAYLSVVALLDAGLEVNELNRGLINYFIGQYGFAVDAFVRYINANPDNHASTAHFYLGLAYVQLGSYEQAIEAWQALIDQHVNERFWAEAYDEIAYTQAVYLQDFDASIETYLAFVDRAPAHESAPEFLYYAARNAEIDFQLGTAANLWSRIGTQFSTSSWAYDGFFQAGIARYRLGEYATTISLMQSSLAVATSSGEQAAAYFWIGKSYEKLGNRAAARESWLQASTSDPTGYYSERALDLLDGTGPFTPPANYSFSYDIVASKAEAESWIKTTFGITAGEDLSDYTPLFSDPRVVRGTELWELGLLEEARREFESYRLSITTDAANTYRLANYLIELGLYRSGIIAARQVLTLAGYDDAGTFSAPVYFNYLRFGAYYSEVVIPVSQAYGFHPMFLYSVIRQESLFEGFVTSTAGARGLMQIIPSTGDSIYRNNGWPSGYTSEDLYRPKVNITFGADYLETQLRYFGGDIYLALAAYNGGPGNAANWSALTGGDQDLLVEVIRFSETRNYIRSIYELFDIYTNLYRTE
jgi:soluble lytic murein transglycosylase